MAPTPEGNDDEITGFSDDDLDKTIKDAYDFTKPLPPPKVPKDLDLNTGYRIFGTPTFTPIPPAPPLPASDASGSNPSLLIGPAHPGPAPFPVTPTPPKPWLAEAERYLTEIAQRTKDTTKSTRFQEHVSEGEVGKGELFPGNERLHDVTPPPAPTSEPSPIPICQLPENGSDMRSWLNAITNTVNGIVERQEQLHHLLIHSISQNNVVASFNAAATSNIENRLNTIEESTRVTLKATVTTISTMGELGEQFERIGDEIENKMQGQESGTTVTDQLASIEAKVAGLTRQTGPSSLPQGTTDAINTIARKVATIEQKVATKVAPNPPAPKNTEPPQPKFATKPSPPPKQTHENLVHQPPHQHLHRKAPLLGGHGQRREMALGTMAQIPTGHIVNTLRA